ncbi:hypothetical protein Spith_0996 [Spirochaeta thermophila DSM 6578]|uniref:Uncharacterized protein n=1 Tax=Winmispira thermophila (strain ATCC 700085 / DSM 6578 / Z-1203) TaxID=869211 RepID=G0GCX6_WINT7|nr:hypothetical protein Spith_0996 [Spirochaeta thermophila DSM 6578]
MGIYSCIVRRVRIVLLLMLTAGSVAGLEGITGSPFTDKGRHFCMGAGLTLLGGGMGGLWDGTGLPLGVGMGIGAAIGKEVWDGLSGGDVEWRDVVATWMGVAWAACAWGMSEGDARPDGLALMGGVLVLTAALW